MSSKFAAVLAAKRDQATEVEEIKLPRSKTEPKRRDNGDALAKDTSVSTKGTQTEARRRGRPNAKRSDPAYVQTTAYIRKKTHRDVKRALLGTETDKDMDFSELVEELLGEWLKQQS